MRRIHKGIRKTTALWGMLLLLFSIPLPVRAEGDAVLTVSSGRGEAGRDVAVDVELSDNPGIWGLKFQVNYDRSVLKLLSIENGAVFSREEVTPPQSLNQEQYVYLACAGQLENRTDNGRVVTLTFSIAEDAQEQSCPITLDEVQAVDAEGNEIGVRSRNGDAIIEKSSDAPGAQNQGGEADEGENSIAAGNGENTPGETGSAEGNTKEPGSEPGDAKESGGEPGNAESSDGEPGDAESSGSEPGRKGGGDDLTAPTIMIVVLLVLCTVGAEIYVDIQKRRNPNVGKKKGK